MMVVVVQMRSDLRRRCRETDGWMGVIWGQDHESLREKARRSTRRPGGVLNHCAVVWRTEMLSLIVILVLMKYG